MEQMIFSSCFGFVSVSRSQTDAVGHVCFSFAARGEGAANARYRRGGGKCGKSYTTDGTVL